MRSFVVISFAFFQFLTLTLPSGLFEILKLFAFALFFIALVVNAFHGKLLVSRISLFSYEYVLFSVVFAWTVLNYRQVSDGGSLILARSIILTVTCLLSGVVLVRNRMVSAEWNNVLFVYSICFYLGVKIFLTLAIFFGVSEDLFSQYLVDLTSTGSLGAPGLNRYVFTNDFAIPFAVLASQKSGLKGLRLISIQFFLAIGGILTLTRYIWICLALVLIYALGWARVIFMIVVGLLFLLYVQANADISLLNAFEARVGEEGAGSVGEKLRQAQILWGEFIEYFWFGKGLGSFVDWYVRNDRLSYGYEVFWLLLLMNFGFLVSVGYVFSFVALIVARYFDCVGKRGFWDWLIFILVYLMSGFFNPAVLGPISAFIILAIYTSTVEDHG